MSVQSVGGGALPDPAAYTYSGSLPAGLAGGSAATTAPASPAAGGGTAGADSPYQKEYATLQQQDDAELLQVSFGSAADASSNVASVLAQAAALQSQQLAAQQQQTLAAANAAVSPSSSASSSSASSNAGSGASSAGSSGASDPLDVPTFAQITDQSDSDAATALSQYQQPTDPGTSIDTLA